jgi:DNA-binding GntR family transcriptional regulator
MVVTRTARDRDGRPVEFARDVYRGDRARFEVSLSS